MALDDTMRRAAAETRAAMAGRRREPMAQVRRRVVMQRVFAVAAGAAAVFLTVGVVGLGGSGDVELLPVGDGVATTADLPLTTTTVTAQESPTIEPTTTAVTTTSVSPVLGEGEGLSDPAGLPEGWPGSIYGEIGIETQLLLKDDGIGIVATYLLDEDYGDHWEVLVATDHRFEIELRFGIERVPGELPELMVGFAIDDDDPLISVFGLAPFTAESVSISVGGAEPVTMDRIYRRPDVNRSVFRGSIPQSAFLVTPPIAVLVNLTGPVGTEPSAYPVEIQSTVKQLSYDGPITSELFETAGPLISDAVVVDSFPEVVECEYGERTDTPPNQGRLVTGGALLPSPVAALEAILDGELADSWFPHGGYVEFTDSMGNVAFGVPFGGDPDQLLVMLIEVTEVDGGWTVSRWEGSGC